MTTDPIAEWLAALGTLTAGAMTAQDAQAKIATYGSMLRGKFPPGAFTMDSLEAVATGSKFFPSYAEVVERLATYWRENRPKPTGPAIEGPSRPGSGHWHGYVAGRLVAGGDRAHLLSLAMAYATPDELRGIMAAFYPNEARAAADHAAEVRRDKAQAAAQVVKAAAAALKPAKPARSAKPAPVAEAKPEVDPHWPLPEPTLREMRDNLVRLEREAATADPPPNAAARIARLRDRIEQERAA